MPVPLRMNVKERESPQPTVPLPPSPPEPVPDIHEILRAITIPPPSITVDPPDLSDIVTAVTSLKPGPTAAEIAAAIADVLRPTPVDDGAPALREVAEALRTLDFRMKGMGRQAYGGGTVAFSGPVTVANPGLTDTELRASAVQVKDDYQTGEILADQSGAGAVLTFTFTNQQSMVVVHSVGANLVSRADPFGGTPSSTLGVRCDDGVPVYMPVQTSSVKVFAPTGTTVTVYGLRRT